LLEGEHTIRTKDSFYVTVIYYGNGTMTCNGEEFDYAQGDEIFVSATINEVHFKAVSSSKILLCHPPSLWHLSKLQLLGSFATLEDTINSGKVESCDIIFLGINLPDGDSAYLQLPQIFDLMNFGEKGLFLGFN